MLLAGVVHDQVGPGLAVDVANQAVALVDWVTLRSPIAGHRHPAGVNQDPSLLGPESDHRGEHRKGDVVDGADADAVHHQIEELKDAGTDLGHALKIAGKMRSRGRAYAHDRRRVAVAAQKLRGGDRRDALALRRLGQSDATPARIGLTRMGEHAANLDAAVPKNLGDVDDHPVVRKQAATMSVAVDLD